MQIQPCFMKILLLLFTSVSLQVSVPTSVCWKMHTYSLTQDLESTRFILATTEHVHKISAPGTGSVLCAAALSPETQAKLGEEAEDFCVTFCDTECACAQIHTVHALASSGCCRQFPFFPVLLFSLSGEIKSIFVFLKIPFSFLNYAC